MSYEWAAGLFEGEGCIKTNKSANASYQLKVKMTDLDVLEKIQAVFNCGSIRPDNWYSKYPQYKPQWVWSVCNRRDVRMILNHMLPHFGTRRAHRALDVLDEIEALPNFT